MRFLYLNIFLLLTIGFLFASSVPFVFGFEDLPSRFASMFYFDDWHTVRGLLVDSFLNVIGFLPLGFAGGALCDIVSGHSRYGLRTFVVAACLSLGVAVLAEGIQLVIPFRTPSCRDVLALETGGILGAALWCAAGRGVTSHICRLMASVVQSDGQRIFRFRWLELFALLFIACLSLNLYATPAEFFVAYSRRITVYDPRMNVQYLSVLKAPRPEHSLWTALVLSLLTSAAIVAAGKLMGKLLPAGPTWHTSPIASHWLDPNHFDPHRNGGFIMPSTGDRKSQVSTTGPTAP